MLYLGKCAIWNNTQWPWGWYKLLPSWPTGSCLLERLVSIAAWFVRKSTTQAFPFTAENIPVSKCGWRHILWRLIWWNVSRFRIWTGLGRIERACRALQKEDKNVWFRSKQARKLQDAQAEKLTILQMNKLVNWQVDKFKSYQTDRWQDDKMKIWIDYKMTIWYDGLMTWWYGNINGKSCKHFQMLPRIVKKWLTLAKIAEKWKKWPKVD